MYVDYQQYVSGVRVLCAFLCMVYVKVCVGVDCVCCRGRVVCVVSGLCDGYFVYVTCFGYVPCKLRMSFIRRVCVQCDFESSGIVWHVGGLNACGTCSVLWWYVLSLCGVLVFMCFLGTVADGSAVFVLCKKR